MSKDPSRSCRSSNSVVQGSGISGFLDPSDKAQAYFGRMIVNKKKKLNLEEKNRRRKVILYGERVSSKLMQELECVKNGFPDGQQDPFTIINGSIQNGQESSSPEKPDMGLEVCPLDPMTPKTPIDETPMRRNQSFIQKTLNRFSFTSKNTLQMNNNGAPSVELPWYDRFILSESSRPKAIFDVIMLILIAYSCFTSVFYVAFNQPTNQFQIILDQIIEAFFWLDLILSFLQEYRDPDTFKVVRSFRLISKRYIFGGSFVVDFAAVFPLSQLVGTETLLAKLLRLFRLPRVLKLIDVMRFSKMIKSILNSLQREERIVAVYMFMYVYRIFRLVIIAFFITYFIGCFWYMISDNLNSSKDVKNGMTFVTYFELENIPNWRKLIISCYYTLTTLATVGYGDYYPISDMERLIAVFLMLCGVAFFSYIMGSFIEIIANYKQKMGLIDQVGDLHNWLTMLTRYTNNKPLPKYLASQIERHFTYYWNNDRLTSITHNDGYLGALPNSIQNQIMNMYLFEDIFFRYRRFFNLRAEDSKIGQELNLDANSRFLYDVAFGFMPRKFEPTDEDRIIYDEEDEVTEMYFILEGNVGVGYNMLGVGGGVQIGRKNNSQHQIAKKLKKHLDPAIIICDHYVFNKQRSQFLYVALKEVKAFGIRKKFLHKEVLPKYPKIASIMKKQALERYEQVFHKPVNEHRRNTIENLNRRSAYKYIAIDEKQGNIINPITGLMLDQQSCTREDNINNNNGIGEVASQSNAGFALERQASTRTLQSPNKKILINSNNQLRSSNTGKFGNSGISQTGGEENLTTSQQKVPGSKRLLQQFQNNSQSNIEFELQAPGSTLRQLQELEEQVRKMRDQMSLMSEQYEKEIINLRTITGAASYISDTNSQFNTVYEDPRRISQQIITNGGAGGFNKY